MNLYLLRHGIAVDHGAPGYPKDADRPLTSEGEQKLKRITKAMTALELKFDLILSSPFTRARQTAEIAAEGLGLGKKLEFSEHLVPDGSHKKLIEELKRRGPRPENILLVGHEPHLSGLISLLVSGDDSLMVEMKKGGLCKLCVSDLRLGRCATLAWLLTPKQMCLMA